MPDLDGGTFETLMGHNIPTQWSKQRCWRWSPRKAIPNVAALHHWWPYPAAPPAVRGHDCQDPWCPVPYGESDDEYLCGLTFCWSYCHDRGYKAVSCPVHEVVRRHYRSKWPRRSIQTADDHHLNPSKHW